MAWDNFASSGMGYFYVHSGGELQELWTGYITEITSRVSNLKSLHLVLTQKLELFENMKNGVSRGRRRLLQSAWMTK